MSYRITLNRPPVIECDTVDEVLALAEVATRFAGRFAIDAEPEPEPERIELPATTIQPRITDTKTATPKQAAKAITAYLRTKGKAARVSELCRELGLVETSVRDALAGPEFLELGKGFFRLADSEPVAASPAASALPKRRGRPPKVQAEPAPEDDSPADEWEEPTRPVRKATPPKPAAPATPNLADRIASVLRANGALGIMTVALHVGESGSLVKSVMTGRPDLFKLTGDGWQLA